VWDLLADVEGWPSWYRACRWVRVESAGRFRWKAHPIALRSTVVASDRPDSFTFIADARGLHAEHAFTLRPAPDGPGTMVLSHETQTGPLPWLGRAVLGPLLHATTQAWLADLARAVTAGPVAREREAVGDAHPR
jgi:Polyketide cyclase / dehydrase and lipid transport